MTNLPKTISDKVKLWELCKEDNPLKELLEEEFRRFSKEENTVSREELFKISFIDNHRINVSFLPKSPSFEKYGLFLTLLSVEMTDEEKDQIYKSVIENKRTKGKMRFKTIKAVASSDYESLIKEEVVEIDIDDIYEIQTLIH